MSLKLFAGAVLLVTLASFAEARTMRLRAGKQPPDAKSTIELVEVTYGSRQGVLVSKNCTEKRALMGPESCLVLQSIDQLDWERLRRDRELAERKAGWALEPTELLCNSQVPGGRAAVYVDLETGDQDGFCFVAKDQSYIDRGSLYNILKDRSRAQ